MSISHVLLQVLKNYIPCWVNTLATVIQLLSSACNPLIYGIFRKEYRKAFKIQYNKICHRMQSRFTSSEYSDSFTSPYYTENKTSTMKRKELFKKSSMNNSNTVHSTSDRNGGTVIQSQAEFQLHLDTEEGAGEMTNSSAALCSPNKHAVGSPVEDPQKRFSLPRRTVSFSDTPELVNQSTEVIAL